FADGYVQRCLLRSMLAILLRVVRPAPGAPSRMSFRLGLGWLFHRVSGFRCATLFARTFRRIPFWTFPFEGQRTRQSRSLAREELDWAGSSGTRSARSGLGRAAPAS